MAQALVLCALQALPASAQVRWFSPGAFSLTCPLDQECQIGGACQSIDDSFAIRHSPGATGTEFDLPGGVTVSGAIAVLDGSQGHSLIASASQDGQLVYRLAVYPNGRVSIMSSHADSPLKDRVWYGLCSDVVSGLDRSMKRIAV